MTQRLRSRITAVSGALIAVAGLLHLAGLPGTDVLLIAAAITAGRPAVTGLHPVEGVDEKQLLRDATAVELASVRIMKQNTFLALGTVALLLIGVLFRQVGLASGMLVHEISVLAVILNALRLTRMQGPRSVAAERTMAETGAR